MNKVEISVFFSHDTNENDENPQTHSSLSDSAKRKPWPLRDGP